MIIPTNDKRFVKDWESTAILNIDDEGYRSFKLDRDRLLQQTKTQNDVAEIRPVSYTHLTLPTILRV